MSLKLEFKAWIYKTFKFSVDLYFIEETCSFQRLIRWQKFPFTNSWSGWTLLKCIRSFWCLRAPKHSHCLCFQELQKFSHSLFYCKLLNKEDPSYIYQLGFVIMQVLLQLSDVLLGINYRCFKLVYLFISFSGSLFKYLYVSVKTAESWLDIRHRRGHNFQAIFDKRKLPEALRNTI